MLLSCRSEFSFFPLSGFARARVCVYVHACVNILPLFTAATDAVFFLYRFFLSVVVVMLCCYLVVQTLAFSLSQVLRVLA